MARGRVFSEEVVGNILRLCRSGLSTHEVARRTGVSQGTVARWARGEVPQRPLHGRGCRDCGGGGPRLASAVDYAYVLGLYLGDGCLSHQGTSVCLRVAFDAAYPSLITEACRAIGEVIPGQRSSLYKRPQQACIVAERLQPPLGVPVPSARTGPQTQATHRARRLATAHREPAHRPLSPWPDPLRWMARRNRVHVKGRDYVYPRYQFSNRSDDIRKIFTDACDHLGVAWRPWGRWHISIARRDAVALLDGHVGPKR